MTDPEKLFTGRERGIEKLLRDHKAKNGNVMGYYRIHPVAKARIRAAEEATEK